MGTVVSTQNANPTPAPVENPELEESTSLWSSIKDLFYHEAPSWLISTIVHVVLFLVLALGLGDFAKVKTPQEVATFVTDTSESDVPFSFEPIKLDDNVEQPRDLDLNTEPEPQEITPNVGELDAGNPNMPDNDGGGMEVPNQMFDRVGSISVAGKDGPTSLGPGFGVPVGRGKLPGSNGVKEGYKNRTNALTIGTTGGPTKTSERAVAAALKWIARHQNADGSWSISHNQKNCQGGACNGGGSSKADVGATALALLPYFAAGQTHQIKGPYQETITRGLQYLVRIQKQNGALAPTSGHEMYEHGLATIALCEAYGMTSDPKIGYAAQAAINYLQDAQNPQGGWRYKARSPDTDTSVVGWQVMGLKSGQMAGLQVKQQVLELAKADLKRAS